MKTQRRKGPKPLKLKDMSFKVRVRAMASRFRRSNWVWHDQQTLINLAHIVRVDVGGGT